MKGDVFLWGSNKHGQLVSESLFLTLPVALDRSLLQGERVTHVHSGWTHIVTKTGESCYTQSHTILYFLVILFSIYNVFTESGRVFTWGRSNYGQLGQTNQGAGKEPDDSTSSGQTISRPIEVKALFGATQVCYQPYTVVKVHIVILPQIIIWSELTKTLWTLIKSLHCFSWFIVKWQFM